MAALVDRLDPDAVSGSAARELWCELDRVERLAAAGKTLLARRVADSHVPDRAGVKTAAEDLACRGGTTVRAARDALDTSSQLAQLPRVEAAVRRGLLSTAQAAAVGDAAAADPTTEQRLVDLAATVSLPELREECARVKAAADPDPAATNARLHRRRSLRRFTDPDGAWTRSPTRSSLPPAKPDATNRMRPTPSTLCSPSPPATPRPPSPPALQRGRPPVRASTRRPRLPKRRPAREAATGTPSRPPSSA
ncbi:MAG TPA: hypothetical protein VFR13_11315 [Jiangellaceae bacterium]|nr:hypothetical protein [Jiangellaceae bacterium]